jgi:hypothetical protein
MTEILKSWSACCSIPSGSTPFDASAAANTSIIADHMNISECLECRPGRAFDAGGIGDIADDAAYIHPGLAQSSGGCRQSVRFNIGEYHFYAGLAERWPSANPMPLAPRSRVPSCQEDPA